MFRKIASIAAGLVLAAAAFFATAQPSQAAHPGHFHGHVHHGGHFGHHGGYYGRAYGYRPYYGGFHGYYRPYYGGHYGHYRPYGGISALLPAIRLPGLRRLLPLLVSVLWLPLLPLTRLPARRRVGHQRNDSMLKITIHDNPEVLTFQLEGKLAGPWVQELRDCWESKLASRQPSATRLDLRGVTFVDAGGQQLLAELHRQHAELLAAGCLMKTLVAEITRNPTD